MIRSDAGWWRSCSSMEICRICRRLGPDGAVLSIVKSYNIRTTVKLGIHWRSLSISFCRRLGENCISSFFNVSSSYMELILIPEIWNSSSKTRQMKQIKCKICCSRSSQSWVEAPNPVRMQQKEGWALKIVLKFKRKNPKADQLEAAELVARESEADWRINIFRLILK